MKGDKSIYICENCGYESPKWMGKCPSCDTWDSFKEIKEKKIKPISEKDKIVRFNEIKFDKKSYIKTGISEIDRVFGGGIVEGGLYLIGGDPGIGKTTLLLEISEKLSEKKKKILFISAEESKEQLKIKAERINIRGENIWISQNSEIHLIKEDIEELKPDFLIIDSIQTVYSRENPSSPGSISQVRDVGCFFLKIAKTKNISTFLIGHVTKSGEIAGPKTLEHMVDCVLYLEGEKKEGLRILRPFKNRFGSTEEIGIFEMTEKGLLEIKDPSTLFISNISSPGISLFPMMEGKRVIMVEIQALVSKTFFPVAKRESQGFDLRRLFMILTVMEKYLNLPLYQYDVYINVAGGIRIIETAGDFPLALAIFSSFKNISLPFKFFSFGEIGLAGEIRNVRNSQKRIQEAKRLGFEKGAVPYDAENITEILKVKTLQEAIKNLFP